MNHHHLLSKTYIDTKLEIPEIIKIGSGTVSVFSTPKPGNYHNEDAALTIALDKNRVILAVADGMGGPPSGEVASRIAIEELARLIGKGPHQDIRSTILCAFDAANDKILKSGIGCGTTLIVAEIDGATLRTYHAGDSAAILVGGKGKLKYRTMNHSPLGLALEAGIEEQVELNDNQMITNMVGCRGMRVEMGPPITLASHDSLIIASDGLFDNISIEEIAIIMKKRSLLKVVKDLIQLVRERMKLEEEALGKADDIATLIYRLA